MSKSAAKFIRANTSGHTTDLLLDTLYTPSIRKNWRNADVLARFLVDTVANAYECENSTTFADNGFDSMEDAIAVYIDANLGDWNQASFLASSFGKRTAQEIADRLAEVMFKNAAFEVKQKQTLTADQKDALREGVDQFRETQCAAFLAYWRATCDVSMTLLTANRTWCLMRDEAIRMNDDFNHAQSMKAKKENAVCCDCEVSRMNWDARAIREEQESGVVCPQLARDTEETRFEAHAFNRTIDLLLYGSDLAARQQIAEYGYLREEIDEIRRIAKRIRRTPRFILRRWAHIAANSFGYVIGECDDLMEALDNAGHHVLAEKVGNLYDKIHAATTTHKGERRNWAEQLRTLASGL